jgi:uncharacterized protein involved in exopolysaccharide biosynthesis
MQSISQPIHGYLRMFFRRKWMLIIPAFAGLILGICLSIMLPKQYKSNTTILVQEGKSDNPLFNNIAIASTMTQRTQEIKETILGWDSLVKLVKRLNLDQNVKTNLEFEQLVFKLRKDISIELRDANIIDLSYVSDEPARAQAVVQNVTDIFIERNVSIQNKETSDAIKFIEEQLHVYLGKIKSAEIAELKDKLNTLLVDSTEDHPMVKELRAQINQKMSDLKKQNLEYSEDAKLSIGGTNPMVDQIQKTLDSIGGDKTATDSAKDVAGDDKDIYKVALIDKLDNVMARDVNVNETIYNTLLQRLETAKITQRLQSSQEGTKYTIIDPPRVPLVPSEPNVPLVILIGLFLGMAAGAGAIFMSEFLDRSFLDVQDASEFLGVPLLGVISRINTVESIYAEKEKNKWILFWMVSIGILTVAFTVMVHAFIKP